MGSASSPQVLRFGNLGYNPGQTILAGTLTTSGTKSAIQQLTSGLTVDSTVDGSSSAVPLCGSSSITNRANSIRFGETLSSCCDVELTLSELQTACTNKVTTQHITSGMYIGIWGGSSYTNTADWILLPDPVDPSNIEYWSSDGLTKTTGQTWDSNALTCRGIYYGSTRLQIAYAYEGPRNNPQARIVSARQVWTPQIWQWPDTKVQSGSQRFPVCYTVTWEEQSKITNQTSSVDHETLYFLFLDEDWGMTVVGKNFVVIFFGAFAMFSYLLYLIRSESTSLLQLLGDPD